MPVLTLPELTTTQASGDGALDVLMRAVRSHLEIEFQQGRLKGPEYSTVYLGSLQLAMQTGLTFLLQRDKNALEAELLQKQIELANVEVQKAQAELLIIQANQQKVPAEIAELEARAALLTQQKLNLVAEALNIPKQGALLEAQVLKAEKEVSIADAELAIKEAEVEIAQAKLINLPKEGALLDAQADKVSAETTLVGVQTSNATAEGLNIPKQGLILVAQECKLRAEFDLITSQTQKSASEIELLAQKTATEKAQTQAIGVDADSVVGRQKGLYQAQTNGFTRDAEQKAAKIMVDVWNVQRTTDTAVTPDSAGLANSAIAAVVNKMRTGIGA